MNTIEKLISFRKLNPSDAKMLSEVLNNSPEDYSKLFIPFKFDEKTIHEILNNLVSDKYIGIFLNEELTGFFMLRGFDAGYEIPSYGVWISNKYQNKGLAKLSLLYAVSLCKLNGIKKIMLKVHPDNIIAKKLYEDTGFVQTGFDDKINNYIYHKVL